MKNASFCSEFFEELNDTSLIAIALKGKSRKVCAGSFLKNILSPSLFLRVCLNAVPPVFQILKAQILSTSFPVMARGLTFRLDLDKNKKNSFFWTTQPPPPKKPLAHPLENLNNAFLLYNDNTKIVYSLSYLQLYPGNNDRLNILLTAINLTFLHFLANDYLYCFNASMNSNILIFPFLQ